MVKRRLPIYLMATVASVSAATSAMVGNKDDKKKLKMEKVLKNLPDSLYETVKKEDLLTDETYIKLAVDGWSSEEIRFIMNDFLGKNKKAKGSFAYGMYAKQWLPQYGFVPGGDSIYAYVDTTYNERAIKGIERYFSKASDSYYEPIPYTPEDRKNKIRKPGFFRPVLQNPNSGRIHWIVLNPENDSCIMVVPDGAGIFRTSDFGNTWDCVTDRIPDREFRKICTHSAIPVDPDDWNHFFAFMKNGNTMPVYETKDGGMTWSRVEGATHKGFKRGYAFKDSSGKLKFIGAVQGYNEYMKKNTLWISEDLGVNWSQVILPDSMKEVHPDDPAMKGAFFQNFAFHPENRDMIYVPASRSIYYFDDGARKDSNGNYNLKRMRFNVYASDGKTLRAENTYQFPFEATTQGFLEINPHNPEQMWFATASRNTSFGVYSAVYRSDDGGKNWITLNEPKNGIGKGLAFGNEAPWGWLGGFGVNFKDTSFVYGCSMSSAKSNSGGRLFTEYAWGNRPKSKQDKDGLYYHVTSARHNADNHCIVSHPSGRVFRGSDAGLLVIGKDINEHEWTSINGQMGNQLHYSIKVNEFGDQIMLGNTQDVDVQTYKYGRWEHWRGYEGTEAFINPYGSTCYFSGSNGGGLEGIEFSSWKEGYTLADVCTGNWYLIHTQTNASLFRIEDFGSKTIDISKNTADAAGNGAGARDFAITREGGRSVLYVLNGNYTLMKSVDNGNTFEVVKVKVNNNLVDAKYSNSHIAVDGNEEDIVYLGQKGMLIKINTVTGDVEDISGTIKELGVSCSELIYHEGSGDIYFFSDNAGLYRRDSKTGIWELWMEGYNPLQCKRIAINYTTQEIVLGDYGRGIWVADIQNPSDRYFKNGFALKEISDVNGRKTIGIDTKWTIPMFYNYSWTVNGEKISNPYQYLTYSLKTGDRVKLTLTMRESPDVVTESAEYVIGSENPTQIFKPFKGKALYSDGKGRVDLGYVDYFHDDFTIDFWIKPESNGVILSNRPVETEKDTRGWALRVDNGNLVFRYAPANMIYKPTYETAFTQQEDLNAGAISSNMWSHVALSHDRDGLIKIYVNGVLKGQTSRILQEYSLNNSVYLSLFADGYERLPIKATVDELRIWKSVLADDDIRKAMFSYNVEDKENLVYYNGFNAGELSLENELFSHAGMKSRTNAVTEYIDMPVDVCADKAAVAVISGKTDFSDSGEHLLYIEPASELSSLAETGVYRYDSNNELVENIDSRYYDVVSDVYQIRHFADLSDTDKINIYIPAEADENERYALYSSSSYQGNKVWNKVAELEKYDSSQLVARGININSVQDRVLVVLRNKEAIELTLADNNSMNIVDIYDKADVSFEVNANIIAGLAEPNDDYVIKSKHGLIRVASPLEFVNGKASTTLSVNLDSLGSRMLATDTIVGMDDRMIPFPVTVYNRILDDGIGHSLSFKGGGLSLDSHEMYNELNGSRTVTMMAWVKIDDENALKDTKTLLSFGGNSSNACGLQLVGGNLRMKWNGNSQNISNTPLSFTTKDIGRWMHVALVVSEVNFRLYLNGVEALYSRSNIPGANISKLYLMQNSEGDKWFTGNMDQVAVWNRSFTADEVRYYMQNHPLMNDEKLVAYIDMDHFNEENHVVDMVSGVSLQETGNIAINSESIVPYDEKESFYQETNATDKGQMIFMVQPSNNKKRVRFSVFDGVSYNCVVPEHPELYPLQKYKYTLVYHNFNNLYNSSDNIGIKLNLPNVINDSTNVSLVLRPLGSSEAFSTVVKANKVEGGKAEFTVAGDKISGATEFMFMTDNASNAVTMVDMSVTTFDGKPVHDGDTIVLSSTLYEFIVNTELNSTGTNVSPIISVKETGYAAIDRNSFDMDKTKESFSIKIDKNSIDKYACNPVTLQLSGVTAERQIRFYVALEPEVKLSFTDITNTNEVYTADGLVVSLPVDVEMLQGALSGNVKLKVMTEDGRELNWTTNTTIGSLLDNTDVRYADNLKFYEGVSPEHEGWNLIGNPYLTNINLTKAQNISFDESYVLKYMYQYNPVNDTYMVWDMIENYDPTQKVSPFGTFFVQTRMPGAEMIITPIAKTTTINRRVFDHYHLVENISMQFGLFDEAGDNLLDRTEVVVQNGTDAGFVLGEDALKMWGGMKSVSNEMATADNTGRYYSVNVVPDRQSEIPLVLRLRKKGKFAVRITNTVGITSQDVIELYDKKTGKSYKLNDSDAAVNIDVTDINETINRYELRINLKDNTTGIDSDNSYTSPEVLINDGNCNISNILSGSRVKVYDLSGRMHVDKENVDGEMNFRLKPGNYIVKINSANRVFTTKIIVK